METKMTLIVAVLFVASAATAGNGPAYPSADLAKFVLEKLDASSLPLEFRPQKEKGKKTFAEYGFPTQTIDEMDASVQSDNSKHLRIRVLEATSSGIFVCIADGQNPAEARKQSVVLLKRKDSSALLKRHITFREFSSCPSISWTDSSGDSY
jgi:hypothetical protein